MKHALSPELPFGTQVIVELDGQEYPGTIEGYQAGLGMAGPNVWIASDRDYPLLRRFDRYRASVRPVSEPSPT